MSFQSCSTWASALRLCKDATNAAAGIATNGAVGCWAPGRTTRNKVRCERNKDTSEYIVQCERERERESQGPFGAASAMWRVVHVIIRQGPGVHQDLSDEDPCVRAGFIKHHVCWQLLEFAPGEHDFRKTNICGVETMPLL